MIKRYLQSVVLVCALVPFGLSAAGQPTIHYQVSESRLVESDLLEVQVNIQYKAQDAAAAAAEVNQVALQIIELSQALDGVTVTSGGYQTWSQPYGKKSMGRVEWVVRQTLSLETQNFQQLLGRLGEIQQAGGQVQGVHYTVSAESRRAIEAQLQLRAITRFRERAAEYAEAAGAGQWALQTLQVGESASDDPVMPMARGMFAMEAAPGVVAPAGKEMLSATVSGVIVLQEEKSEIKAQIESLTGKVVEKLQGSVSEGLEYAGEAVNGAERLVE
jgi:predicted secreted protein